MKSILIAVLVYGLSYSHANNGNQAPFQRQVNPNGQTTYLSGPLNTQFKSGRDINHTFMQKLAGYYELSDLDEMRTQKVSQAHGQTYYRVAQFHAGLRVIGGDLIVQTDEQGNLQSVLGATVPGLDISLQPSYDSHDAINKALAQKFPSLSSAETVDVDLVVYTSKDEKALAYEADVWVLSDEGFNFLRLYADARSGSWLGGYSHIHTFGLDRKIYTVNWACVEYISQLPGDLWFDPAIPNAWQTMWPYMPFEGKQAYYNTGTTYMFFDRFFGYTSFDDQDATIISSINVEFPASNNQCSPNNAAFIGGGINQFLYGDGDGNILDYPSQALDVTAHEFMHGVTEFTSNLDYEFDSGAINESMSDIFGAGAEAWANCKALYGSNRIGNPKLMHAFADTWLIGEDAVGPALVPALRFMNDPAADNSSSDYYPHRTHQNCTSPGNGNDHCGVHSNSGIGNLAFYLLSEGGVHPQNKSTDAVFGIGFAKALRVFFEANRYLLNPTDDYQALRFATGQAAINLFGTDSGEYVSVMKAWDAVAVPGVWTAPVSCELDVLKVFETTYASPQVHGEYYVIDVSGNLQITLTWPSGANLGMEIYDPNFNVVGSATGPARYPSRTLSVDGTNSPGRYTIFVSSGSNLPSAFYFELDVNYEP